MTTDSQSRAQRRSLSEEKLSVELTVYSNDSHCHRKSIFDRDRFREINNFLFTILSLNLESNSILILVSQILGMIHKCKGKIQLEVDVYLVSKVSNKRL